MAPDDAPCVLAMPAARAYFCGRGPSRELAVAIEVRRRRVRARLRRDELCDAADDRLQHMRVCVCLQRGSVAWGGHGCSAYAVCVV